MFKFLFFGSKRSSSWKKVRAEHIKIQPLCQACNSKNNLEVHHIEPYYVKPERELDPSNLITLCKTCHLVFGHLMNYKSWNIEVIKDSAEYLQKVKKRPEHETFGSNNGAKLTIIDKLICWYKRSFCSR